MPSQSTPITGIPPASRGLPTILWNNDSDSLTWPAYPEYHADGLWVPDGPNLPLPKLNSVEDYLALRLGPLAKTMTQGLSYCGNFGVPVWDLRRDHIAALGDDPLQPILQFWKRDGRTFFFSMRMNDIHHVFREWTVSWNDFRRTHRHLLLNPPTDQEWESEFVPWLAGKAEWPAIEDWSSLAFDYSRAEVRTHYLDTLHEACRRYELDGVEFDWLRHPYLFREGEVNAATVTAFVHEARTILDDAAKQRGHAMRLVTRVPMTPAQALAIGLDVEAWLQAGWLDAIIAGHGTTFSSCPLEQWVALAHRYGVPVYGSLERRNVHGVPRYGSPEALRAAIATLWHKGADGLYFFNFYHRHEMPLLDEFADTARLARLPKEYFLESRANDLPHMPSTITPGSCARNCAACALRQDGPLPLELTPGQAAKVSVFIADEPGQAANLHLECAFKGPLALAACSIRINGRQVEGLRLDHDNQIHVKGDCEFTSHELRQIGPPTISCASPSLATLLRRGDNEFVFTSSVPAVLTALSVRVTP